MWSKVEGHPTFDTSFHKILNVIGDICDKICYFMWQINSCDLSQCLCNRYHDI